MVKLSSRKWTANIPQNIRHTKKFRFHEAPMTTTTIRPSLLQQALEIAAVYKVHVWTR